METKWLIEKLEEAFGQENLKENGDDFHAMYFINDEVEIKIIIEEERDGEVEIRNVGREDWNYTGLELTNY